MYQYFVIDAFIRHGLQDVLQQAKMGVQLGAGAFAAVSTINMMLPEGSAVVALKHVKVS